MISTIILAAGMSKRMKQGNKLLLKYNHFSILENTLKNLSRSKINEILVVLGHDSKNVEKALKNYDCKIILNRAYLVGMSSSIIKGLELLNPISKGVMICLGDMPNVKTETYDTLIKTFKDIKAERKIILPIFNNQRGNPIILSSFFFKLLLNLTGDKGAKELINKHKDCIIEKKVQDKGVLEDIDNDEQYNILKKND